MQRRIPWFLLVVALASCGRTPTTGPDGIYRTGPPGHNSELPFEVQPATGFVSGNQRVVIKGRGFAPGMRAFVGDAVAPVAALDDQTAVLITPPGPAGRADVTLEIGGNAQRSVQAFEYVSAGFASVWTAREMAEPRG